MFLTNQITGLYDQLYNQMESLVMLTDYQKRKIFKSIFQMAWLDMLRHAQDCVQMVRTEWKKITHCTFFSVA